MYLTYRLYILYAMYMTTYTVTDFRDNLREALNTAESGHPVMVERHGILFILTKKQDSLAGAPKKIIESLDGVESPGPTVIKDAHTAQKITANLATDKAGNGLCKVHGTPLDTRGKCLQKGCKYA